MNPLQSLEMETTHFFSLPQALLRLHRCGGWSPVESKPHPLMGSTEASRRDCGIFCLRAPAVTSYAARMSQADGSLAFAVDFV